jgi:endonuclease-3
MIMNKLKVRKEKAQKMIEKLKQLFPNAKSALNYSNNWEFLVAVMLSPQTTDKLVNKVTESLFKKYPELSDYVKTDVNEFDKYIHSVNYHHTKAKNILATAKIIQEKYHGRLPHTIAEMTEFPGVGRKIANVVVGNLFGKPEGIAVDTHVRRLSKLYGLTDSTDPKKIEQDLMEIIPPDDWTQFTHLMIEYGRTYCPARKHDHVNCPLTQL